MAKTRLDEIDLAILGHLQGHARIANVDLAERVGLSAAPCLRRVRALEQAGVIRRYVALLEPGAIAVDVTVFVQVSFDLPIEARHETFEEVITRRSEVLECYLTGDCDYLLRVAVPDVAAYRGFVRDCLARIDGVVGVKSTFAMQQVKYSTELPIPNQVDAASSKAPPDTGRPFSVYTAFGPGRGRDREHAERSAMTIAKDNDGPTPPSGKPGSQVAGLVFVDLERRGRATRLRCDAFPGDA